MSRLIPRGAVVAGLGKRVLAAVIDALPFLLIGGLSWLATRLSDQPTVVLVTSIAAGVLSLAFALYQWWAYASRGAGLGAQLTGLRLVSIKDGQPIGWWRVFLRYLIFGALMGTVVGGIAMLVFLVIHERRQGWHDMATKAVVVQPKKSEARATASEKKKTAKATTVGLPPHLASSFSPQAGTTSAPSQSRDSFAPKGGQPSSAPSAAPQPSAPDWLPGVQSEPVQPAAQQPYPQQQAQPPATGQWQAPTGFQQSPQPQTTQFPAPQPSAPQPQPSPWNSQPPTPPVQPSKPQAQWIPLPTPASVIEPSVKVRPRNFGEGSMTDAGVGSGIHWACGFEGCTGGGFQQSPQPQTTQFPAPQPSAPQPQPSKPQAQWIPLPTPASVIEPSVKVRPRNFGEVDDDEGTRIANVPARAGRAGDEGWYVRLDDGREVDLKVTVLLGRNPQKGADDDEVQLVPASGDGRMISRTHVQIGTDPRGVYVVDRGSTNGTAVVTAGGELEPCPAGTQVRVREGQQVSYGNRWFTVLRRPIV
ncbi:RDD family protein [Tessaracoccus massiliensis]|uniref:RDD family protein n=1 Tax=Tessaracoccus massiliensis TaxID=1522311 RepID=UPI00069397AD|nr:RDD family protein [Tessaracoccus massiliensis]